jgi:hypothetical protein
MLFTCDDALGRLVLSAFEAAGTRVEMLVTPDVGRLVAATVVLLDMRTSNGAARVGRSLVRLLAVQRAAPPVVAVIDDAEGLAFANDYGMSAVRADGCGHALVAAAARAEAAHGKPHFAAR